jgi:hypothetical protein
VIHPDDDVPQTAPIVQRDVDLRELQVFDIRFGNKQFGFTSRLTVRRHPGTDEITLALAPRKDPT